MKNMSKTALILPGGGARGAYQVGVVKGITEILASKKNPFPIICGTSAGAINAAVLASHADKFNYGISQLEKFWGQLRCHDVYRTDSLSIASTMLHMLGSVLFGFIGLKAPHSLLDNSPLAKMLHRALYLPGIERAIGQGALDAVAVTASAYTTANAMTFYQGKSGIHSWQRNRRKGIATTLQVKHIMASAALPFLFPAQRIETQYFGDGGLRMVAPLAPAIHLGANKILIIGTRDQHAIEVPRNKVDYPSMAELGGYMLDTLFMDNLDADLSRMLRINHTLSLMGQQQRQQSHLRELTAFQITPSRDVREITREHADHIPTSVRFLMRSIGGWGNDWRMPSYLLFEAEYTQTLMRLGYSDAIAQADELLAFFGSTVAN